MKNGTRSSILQADNLAGLVIIAFCGWLLMQTRDMPPMSALLPVAMLCAMAILATAMILRNLLRQDADVTEAIFVSLPRFLLVVCSIFLYTLAVATLGFYTATTIMVPAVAWCFGYRRPLGLAIATVIFVGGTALIFFWLMNQSLPPEFFAR